MTTASADIIDLLAGLTSGGERGVALAAVRDERPQARENAQRSFEALLEPAAPGTFPLAERYAVAAYVAQLHAFDTATAFYGDLLGDEEPALVAPVAAAAAASATSGPYGLYREPALAGESVEGLRWTPDAEASAALGDRLAAALAHAHLLVFRPRGAGRRPAGPRGCRVVGRRHRVALSADRIPHVPAAGGVGAARARSGRALGIRFCRVCCCSCRRACCCFCRRCAGIRCRRRSLT